jgi:predicted enzyme related to lactoylglutathione lyase
MLQDEKGYHRQRTEEASMTIGEVCLLTNDVPGLAAFYKQLLGVENGSNDETHQFILPEGPALTVYNDGTVKNNSNQNICLAFTVDDIDRGYEKVLALGAEIIEPPTKRPWGMINMSFYDPDNNMVFFRSFPENESQTT